jgi:drug/metabolite transporter (DMT)-like permease
MEKKHFFDKPKNVKGLFLVFCASLIVVLVLEFFIHKHPHFPWEKWPGFYATFGFVAFVSLILAAKYILRPLIKRKEDYYD